MNYSSLRGTFLHEIIHHFRVENALRTEKDAISDMHEASQIYLYKIGRGSRLLDDVSVQGDWTGH